MENQFFWKRRVHRGFVCVCVCVCVGVCTGLVGTNRSYLFPLLCVWLYLFAFLCNQTHKKIEWEIVFVFLFWWKKLVHHGCVCVWLYACVFVLVMLGSICCGRNRALFQKRLTNLWSICAAPCVSFATAYKTRNYSTDSYVFFEKEPYFYRDDPMLGSICCGCCLFCVFGMSE